MATSCAADYVTWANAYPPGTSRDGAVTVHRFAVARERPLREFWTLGERMFDGRASEDEQRRWFALNGPDVPALLRYLAEHGPDYDRVIFFAFRYAPSWFGLPLVAGLDMRQLAGVLAHEIAHIRNRDTLIGMIASAFAGALVGLVTTTLAPYTTPARNSSVTYFSNFSLPSCR